MLEEERRVIATWDAKALRSAMHSKAGGVGSAEKTHTCSDKAHSLRITPSEIPGRKGEDDGGFVKGDGESVGRKL